MVEMAPRYTTSPLSLSSLAALRRDVLKPLEKKLVLQSQLRRFLFNTEVLTVVWDGILAELSREWWLCDKALDVGARQWRGFLTAQMCKFLERRVGLRPKLSGVSMLDDV